MGMRSPWWNLQGLFCIFKPADLSLRSVRGRVIANLVKDLNEQHIPKNEKLVTIEGSISSRLTMKVEDKLAVHPLAVGPVYTKEDLRISCANHLAVTTSGICLFGINKGVHVATVVKHSRLIRTYRLSGLLGKATINLHHSGKLVEVSSYEHVGMHHVEKVFMMIQASHQKRAMQFLGGNMDTQGAYEALSEEGIVRPSSESFPLAYSLKCIEFHPPNFTLEVSCINETEHFLRKLIHDTGLLLKTNATTTHIRCIRYGPFTLDDALLRKHWKLDYIIENIEMLRSRARNVRPQTPSLQLLEQS